MDFQQQVTAAMRSGMLLADIDGALLMTVMNW